MEKTYIGHQQLPGSEDWNGGGLLRSIGSNWACRGVLNLCHVV